MNTAQYFRGISTLRTALSWAIHQHEEEINEYTFTTSGKRKRHASQYQALVDQLTDDIEQMKEARQALLDHPRAFPVTNMDILFQVETYYRRRMLDHTSNMKFREDNFTKGLMSLFNLLDQVVHIPSLNQ